jgi:zinc/manganese transport system ATP-binding protein
VLLSAHELSPLLGAIDRVLYLGGGQAAIGLVDEVITSETLSRLYGGPVQVARVGGRIFVLPGAELAVSDGCHAHSHARAQAGA